MAVGFTLVILAIGLHSLRTNGVNLSSSFSGILCTTRNPELDILTRGSFVGSQPLDDALKKQKLQFGLLQVVGKDARTFNSVGFGPPASVRKWTRVSE